MKTIWGFKSKCYAEVDGESEQITIRCYWGMGIPYNGTKGIYTLFALLEVSGAGRKNLKPKFKSIYMSRV